MPLFWRLTEKQFPAFDGMDAYVTLDRKSIAADIYDLPSIIWENEKRIHGIS